MSPVPPATSRMSLARLRVELGGGGVLPEPVHARRDMASFIRSYFAGDAIEHLAHAPGLFGLGHVLEAEGGGVVAHRVHGPDHSGAGGSGAISGADGFPF